MKYKEYLHIERKGTDEVDNLELGDVYVFSKVDGSNGVVWLQDDGTIGCGSRHRELTLEKDNQGFMKYIDLNRSIYSISKLILMTSYMVSGLFPTVLKLIEKLLGVNSMYLMYGMVK